jgi:flap endonuclease-1
MGIKSFGKLIKELKDQIVINVPITNFANRKIFIDAHNWFYTYYYISRKSSIELNFSSEINEDLLILSTRQRIIEILLDYLNSWLRFKILPVFVFDGIRRTEKIVCEERDKEEKKKFLRYNLCLGEINKMDFEKLYTNKEMIINSLACNFVIPREEFQHFRSFFKNNLLPYCLARNDGEQVISYLNKEKHCCFVVSSDYDLLAFGAEYIYQNLGMPKKNLEILVREKVKKSLGLNEEEFLDLLILSGCDFNKNIKGIGVKKAFKLIKTHSRIENIPKIDKDCLRLEVCRRIFKEETLEETLPLASRFDQVKKEEIAKLKEQESNKKLISIFNSLLKNEFNPGWVNLVRIRIKEGTPGTPGPPGPPKASEDH